MLEIYYTVNAFLIWLYSGDLHIYFRLWVSKSLCNVGDVTHMSLCYINLKWC